MTAAARVDELELEMPTGPALGAGAALRSLEENDADDSAASSDEDAAASTSLDASDDQPGETEIPDAAADSKPRRSPAAKKAESPNAMRKRIGKLKRAELAALYVDLFERYTALEAKLETMTAEVATTRANGADVIDEATNDLVGDAIDLVDSSVQFFAKDPHVADAMALEQDERAHLLRLGARVAKIRGGKLIAERSPELALGLAAAAIVLGKGIAYRRAKLDAADGAHIRSLPTTPAIAT